MAFYVPLCVWPAMPASCVDTLETGLSFDNPVEQFVCHGQPAKRRQEKTSYPQFESAGHAPRRFQPIRSIATMPLRGPTTKLGMILLFQPHRPLRRCCREGHPMARSLNIAFEFSYDYGIDRRTIQVDDDHFHAERDPGSRFARTEDGQISDDDYWAIRSILRDPVKLHRMVPWLPDDQYPKSGAVIHYNTWTATAWSDFIYRLRATCDGKIALQYGWSGKPLDQDTLQPHEANPVLVPEAVRDIVHIMAKTVGPL
jgi:hypothetical protein